MTGGNTKVLKSSYRDRGRVPVIDQGQDFIAGYVDSDDSVCRVEPPVILFGDHTCAFKYVDFPFALGADGVKVLKPKPGFDAKYLYHFLRQLKLPDTGYDRHFKYLKRAKFPPRRSLAEQKRIAAILDKADAIRRRRREADEHAHRLSLSIYYEMFGDARSNPRGWDFDVFDQVCESRLGKMLDAGRQTGQHSRPYLRNANVQWNRFDLDDVLEMDFDESDRKEFKLVPGDLLICEGGEVGRTAIWRGDLEECYFQKALHRARPRAGKATSEFIAWLMRDLSLTDGFRLFTSQATIAHLTGEKLKTLPIPVPPYDLQIQFSERIRSVESMLAKRSTATRQIDDLFNSLVQQAFRGEL